MTDATVQTYTHSKSGTVHNFVGTGTNGKAKITADFVSGDTFQVNGTKVTAYWGTDTPDADLIANGHWVSFIVDNGTINFKPGCGLTSSKLAQATATESDVLSGKTFYAKNKSLKTGNIASKGTETVTLNASTTSKTFSTSGKLCTGNMVVNTSTMAGSSVTLNPGGTYTFETSGKLCTGNMSVTVNPVNTWPIRSYCPYNSSSGSNVNNATVYLPLPDGDGTYYIYLHTADIQSTGDAKHVVKFQGETWVDNTSNGGNYGVHPDWYRDCHTRYISNSNRTINYTWRYYGTIVFIYCRVS